MSPKKTIFISIYTEMGGGEYGLFHLLEHLDRRRIEPILVVNAEGPLTRRVAALGIRVVTIPFEVVTLRALFSGKGLRANIAAARELRRFVAHEGVGAVSCGDVLSLLLLLPSLLSIPLRVVYHVIFFYEPVRKALFNVLALLFVDRIVVLSEAMRRDLAGGTVGLASKIDVSYWGVDTDRFRPLLREERLAVRERAGLPAGAVLVGLVGRYEVWKGHLTFLDAAERLCAERSDVRALLVGGAMTSAIIPEVAAYHERVRERIASFSPAGALVALGHRDDVASVMASLDVVVCPSDREPYGLVVLESLACGVPVVVSSSVGALEVVEGKKGVFICAPGDAGSLLGAIKSAISCSIEADDLAISAKMDVKWPYWRDYASIVQQKIGE